MTAALDDQPTRRRVRPAVIGLLMVLGVLAVVSVMVLNRSGSGPPLPAGVSTLGGGVVVGSDAPVVVDEWFDFACPACAQANAKLGGTVDDLVESGEIQVVYHPLSFVTPTGSGLAANAFGCASDAGVAREFHAAVLGAQGEDGTEFTNDQLIGIGTKIGIEGDSFAECVNGETYQEWVDNVAASGLDADIAVTPTFVVNGEQVAITDNDPQVLREAVAAAAATE